MAAGNGVHGVNGMEPACMQNGLASCTLLEGHGSALERAKIIVAEHRHGDQRVVELQSDQEKTVVTNSLHWALRTRGNTLL